MGVGEGEDVVGSSAGFGECVRTSVRELLLSL